MWGRGPFNRQAFVVRSTPAERRGLAVLLLFSALYIGWRNSPSHASPAAQGLHVCDLLSALEQVPAQTASTASAVRRRYIDRPSHAERAAKSAKPILVSSLDSAGWNALGLSPKQSAVAVRYGRAVNGIGDRETLARLRVLPKGWLEAYASRLIFSQVSSNRAPPTKTSQQTKTIAPKPIAKPDLNTADSLSLLRVHGIGPWVAARILEARRSWGGIASSQDFTDALRGWDSLSIALSPRLTWDTATLRCQCPDTLSVEQWAALPGVNFSQARTLMNYRANHPGEIRNLHACLAVDSAFVERILPYLCALDSRCPPP